MLKINNIYQGDCLDVIKEIDDMIIDLTVTSPPYDNLRTYDGYSFNFEGIAKELFRITKSGGVVVWVVGDVTKEGDETGTPFKQALFFKECGFKLHDTMIYLKDSSPYPSINRYRQIWEYMFVFVRDNIKTFNPIKRRNLYRNLSRNSYRQRTGETIFKTVQSLKEGIAFNVWQYETGFMKTSKDKISFKHPATFPEKLAEDHILSWSNKGDLVLDPFMGSGTTAKMAKLNNRNYIGIELNPEYIEIANKRIANTHVNRDIFETLISGEDKENESTD